MYNFVERAFLYTFSGGKWNRQTKHNDADSVRQNYEGTSNKPNFVYARKRTKTLTTFSCHGISIPN
jgi:hypothetical protein